MCVRLPGSRAARGAQRYGAKHDVSSPSTHGAPGSGRHCPCRAGGPRQGATTTERRLIPRTKLGWHPRRTSAGAYTEHHAFRARRSLRTPLRGARLQSFTTAVLRIRPSTVGLWHNQAWRPALPEAMTRHRCFDEAATQERQGLPLWRPPFLGPVPSRSLRSASGPLAGRSNTVTGRQDRHHWLRPEPRRTRRRDVGLPGRPIRGRTAGPSARPTVLPCVWLLQAASALACSPEVLRDVSPQRGGPSCCEEG